MHIDFTGLNKTKYYKLGKTKENIPDRNSKT